MRAFTIAKGTTIKIIKEKTEWYAENFAEHVTTKENMFFLEDMVVDPTGILGQACGPQHKRTIGGAYAAAGNYGFKRDGWVALIPAGEVTVL